MAATQTDPQYKLRLSADLLERIRTAAEANRRSMNAEMVARLESTFQGSPFEEPLSSDVVRQIVHMHNHGLLLGSSGLPKIEEETSIDEIKRDLRFIKSQMIMLNDQSDISKILPGEHFEKISEYMSTLPEPKPSRVEVLRYIIKRGLEVVLGAIKSDRMRA